MEVDGPSEGSTVATPVFGLSRLRQADGSAEYQTEKATVLAAVFGPGPVKAKQERADGATVQVSVETLCSPPDLELNALSIRLEEILEKVILRSLHPRSLIAIGIQPVHLEPAASPADLFVTSFNAAIAALVDAGVPLLTLPLAASLGEHSYAILDSSGSAASSDIAATTTIIHASLTLPGGKSLAEITGKIQETARVDCSRVNDALQRVVHAAYS